MVGNGRFCPPDEVVSKNPNPLKKYGQQPVLLAQLNIEYSDGAFAHVSTNSLWKTALAQSCGMIFMTAKPMTPDWNAPVGIFRDIMTLIGSLRNRLKIRAARWYRRQAARQSKSCVRSCLKHSRP
jgi:hypothetical protein